MSRNTKKLIVGAVALAALAGLGYVIWNAMDTKRSGEDTVYMNNANSYWFAYPNTYDLNEVSPDNVMVGTRTKEGFEPKVEVTVIESEEGRQYSSFETFAIDQARQFCPTDSPDLVLSCTGVESQEAFSAETGLTGTMFYLTLQTRSVATGEVVTTRKGPFYAFDASAVNVGPQFTLLLVRPPTAVAQEDVDAEAIRTIANTTFIVTPQPEQPVQ